MNTKPYRDAQGNHVIGGPLTGWASSDAVRQSKCPRCGSDPGYHCDTPSGRKAWPPHHERFTAEIQQAATLSAASPWQVLARLANE